MNDPLNEARQFLPNMPEEIFTLWFDGRIKSNGWPPNSRIWQGALRYRPLHYWRTLQWEKQRVKLDFEKFTESAKGIVTGLIGAVFNNILNAYSDPALDSKSKIFNVLEYVKENNILPKPLIFLQEDNLYEIVDGSHRLAVFFALHSHQNTKSILDETQLAWVGLPSPKRVSDL